MKSEYTTECEPKVFIRRRHGFRVAELLVEGAVLAMIFALLVPAFTKKR